MFLGSVDVRIGIKKHTVQLEVGVARNGSTDHLVRCPADVPHKQSAAFVNIKSLDNKKKRFLGRGLDKVLSFVGWRRASNGAQWGHVRTTFEIPGAAEAQ